MGGAIFVGASFGRWTVIKIADQEAGQERRVHCKCVCGNEKLVRAYTLMNGESTSCGCLRKEQKQDKSNVLKSKTTINLIGQRFGRLTVEDYAGSDKGRGAKWRCLCDCGREKVVTGISLKNNGCRSCGCLNDEIRHTKGKNAKHGLKHTRLYNVWSGIKRRCYIRETWNYANYGGRGIVMCNEWRNSFIAFHDWAEQNVVRIVGERDDRRGQHGAIGYGGREVYGRPNLFRPANHVVCDREFLLDHTSYYYGAVR